MDNSLVAHASATVEAPVAVVWDALVNPAVIKQYMFGADVTSNWKEGSPTVSSATAISVRSKASWIRLKTTTPSR
jgi:uncharacterized protein YndB with AHSA1/START domain